MDIAVRMNWRGIRTTTFDYFEEERFCSGSHTWPTDIVYECRANFRYPFYIGIGLQNILFVIVGWKLNK